MAKFYKQISTCSMCKGRFVKPTEKGMFSYAATSYCDSCRKKYFPASAAQASPG